MATIINNPPANDNSGGPIGIIIGIIVLIVLGYLGYVYGLPAVRQKGTPQINVPSKIDVNVNQTK
ncbi:MAG: hypothetical protein Q7S57_00455 [bacterium]|nr:hypothetical protein [bacterium]